MCMRTSNIKGHVAKGVQFLMGSCAEDSDANLTLSPYNLTTTKVDFEAFVKDELPWANDTVKELMIQMYLNDTGVPHVPSPPTSVYHSNAKNANDANGLKRIRLNTSYSKWYWAAKHMLADAEMFCSNRRAARWINRANRRHTRARANSHLPQQGDTSDGYARMYIFAHVPLLMGPGSGSPHNGDTAFWFHVENSSFGNASAGLKSSAEVALSSIMTEWWLRTAASGNPNRPLSTNSTAGANVSTLGGADNGVNGVVWPSFPLTGKGGPSAEPVMVMDTKEIATDKGSYLVYGARAQHCIFWDRLSYLQTPED